MSEYFSLYSSVEKDELIDLHYDLEDPDVSIKEFSDLPSSSLLPSTSSKINSSKKWRRWEQEEIDQLKELMKKHDRNWNLISKELKRTPQQCSVKASQLRDSEYHVKWTTEEIEKLRSLVEIHQTKNWKQIAKEMGTRTPSQCVNYYNNHLKRKWKQGRWEQEEEDRLKEIVSRIPVFKWKDISELLNRKPQDCRQKWLYMKQPGLKTGKWSHQEEEVLAKLKAQKLPISEISNILERNTHQIYLKWKSMAKRESSGSF
jgi:hypothetical protein